MTEVGIVTVISRAEQGPDKFRVIAGTFVRVMTERRFMIHLFCIL